MITLQPLLGVSISPTPLSEASGIECFKLISTNPSIAEISRKQEVVQEKTQEFKKSPSVKREKENNMKGLELKPPSLSMR